MPLRPSERAFERRQRAAAERELRTTVREAVQETRAHARLYDARLRSGTVEIQGSAGADA